MARTHGFEASLFEWRVGVTTSTATSAIFAARDWGKKLLRMFRAWGAVVGVASGV